MMSSRESILRTLPVLAAGTLCCTGLVSHAGAQDKGDDSVTATSMRMPVRLTPAPGGVAGAGFVEDFETGFVAGPINGQNGWTHGPPNNPGNAVITDVDPIQGSFSARLTSGGGSGELQMNSPEFPGGTQFGSVSGEVVITGGAATFQFITVDLFPPPQDQFFNTRVQFNPNGNIEVAQVNMAKTQFVFMDSGADWSVGVPMRICVQVVDQNGELNVFKDGVLIFSGDDTHFVLNGSSNGIGGYLTFCSNLGASGIYRVDDFNEDCGPPVGPPCPEDTNGDTEVDVDDLVNVILDWDGPGIANNGDVNDDGIVDVDDLVAVILAWGLCPVLNNGCANALVVGEGTTGFNNGGTSIDITAPPFSCGDPVNDVWFRFVANCNGDLNIDTNGSGFDTVLEVYAGSNCPPGASLACDDDSGAGNASLITIPGVLQGQVFTIRVGGNAGDPEDQGSLTIDCVVSLPANDECGDAALLTLVDDTVTVSGQTNTATTSPEPFPCDSICPMGGDVWYRIQGTAGTLTASLCGAGTNFDTILMVYCGPDCASLGCIGGDDEGCDEPGAGLPSEFTWCASASQTYWINVQGFRSTDTGSFELTVTRSGTCPTPAACQSGDLGVFNDQCIDATEIVGSQDLEINTTGACTDGLAHAGCQFDGQTYQDVWFRFTADCEGTLRVSTCNQAKFDTDIAVYDGSNWPAVCPPGAAALIACNDDGIDPGTGEGCADFGSVVNIEGVEIGNEYLIRVGGRAEGFQGVTTLSIGCFVQDNDSCDLAVAVGPPGNPGGHPSSITQSSCGATGEPALPDCGNGPPNQSSRWYVAEGDGTSYTVSLCNSTDDSWDSRLTVFCGECDDLSCDLPALFEPIDGCGLSGQNEEVTFCTADGVSYLILVSSAFGCGDYTLEVTSDGSPCADGACSCDVGCSGTAEPEACGANVNGGCNSGGQQDMTPAGDGDTFCGTVWADNSARDTDWYIVEVGPSGGVQAQLTSGIPVTAFWIVDPGQNCFIPGLIPVGTTAFSDDCEAGTAIAGGLTPGDMVYCFVATGDLFGEIFNGFPCGGNNDYELIITAP